jgi:adenosylhomocysteine nucleosidase
MIAVTFALPQESKKFRSALRHPTVDGSRRVTRGNLGEAEIVLAHTGVGLDAATTSVRTLLRAYRADYLICAGFAGALDPGLRVGDLIVATNYSSANLLPPCRAALAGNSRSFFGSLTTERDATESAAAKTDLARRTGALAVDMETSAVALECAQAGIPILAVRVISDAASSSLPVPMADWFDLQSQRPRPVALFCYLATHGKRVVPFVHFVSALPHLRAVLAGSLVELIAAIDESNGTAHFHNQTDG